MLDSELKEEQLKNIIKDYEFRITQLQLIGRGKSNKISWNRMINRLRIDLHRYERLLYELKNSKLD